MMLTVDLKDEELKFHNVRTYSTMFHRDITYDGPGQQMFIEFVDDREDVILPLEDVYFVRWGPGPGFWGNGG